VARKIRDAAIWDFEPSTGLVSASDISWMEAGWVTREGRYECRSRHDGARVAAAPRAWAVERGVDLSQWPEKWRLFLAQFPDES
jgi:hypothetical protein